MCVQDFSLCEYKAAFNIQLVFILDIFTMFPLIVLLLEEDTDVSSQGLSVFLSFFIFTFVRKCMDKLLAKV